MTTPSYQHVDTAAIDCTPLWNLHPWSTEIPTLIKTNLEEVGILHPLRVIITSPRKFTLIAGNRRLHWAKKKGIQKVPCAIYPEKSDAAKLLAIIVEEQKFSGELNMAEKARILEISSQLFLQKNQVSKLYNQLQLKQNPALLKSLAALLKEHPSLLIKIDQGSLSFQVYEDMKRLKTEQERTTILKLFTHLQLGNSKQRRMLQMLKDCAYKDSSGRKNITTLLNEEEFSQIIYHKQLNIPQKIQHLSTILEKRIHPELIKAEEEFQMQVKELNLPDNQKIYHSPAFEKDEVHLEIRFKNFSECILTIKEQKNSPLTN